MRASSSSFKVTDHKFPRFCGMAVSRRAAGAVLVLEVAGDIDMVSAPELDRRISDLVGRANFQRLVVDLTQVEFLAASGVSCLLRGHAAATAAGREMCVAAGSAPAARVLELCGATRQLRTAPSTDVAAMAAGPSPHDPDGASRM